MIKLIIGNKGSGKTKTLIAMVNEAVKSTAGNVVCVEKGLKLTYDLDHAARLIDSDAYGIQGFDMLYGFLCGIMAGNYDITELFVDATFKIGGRDYTEFGDMIKKLNEFLAKVGTNVTFTVSCDISELPEEIKSFSI